VVGCAHDSFGRLEAERFYVLEEGLDVFFGILANFYSGSGGVLDDAIVHVREIHDVVKFVSAYAQESPKNILEDKRPKISNVREVVDGRPAGIHPNFARMDRLNRLPAVP
jgi:hypothetical protein